MRPWRSHQHHRKIMNHDEVGNVKLLMDSQKKFGNVISVNYFSPLMSIVIVFHIFRKPKGMTFYHFSFVGWEAQLNVKIGPKNKVPKNLLQQETGVLLSGRYLVSPFPNLGPCSVRVVKPKTDHGWALHKATPQEDRFLILASLRNRKGFLSRREGILGLLFLGSTHTLSCVSCSTNAQYLVVPCCKGDFPTI